MVSPLAVPPAIQPIPDATKHLPGEPHQCKNGVYTNGKAGPDLEKIHTNGHINGLEDGFPTRNSSDIVFGPRKSAGGVYEMLNQPLGATRPLKIIYLGGGASGKSDQETLLIIS